MIQDFCPDSDRRIQSGTISQYVAHPLYGLRYLYLKVDHNTQYRQEDLYIVLARLRECHRKQTVRSTA